MLKYVLWVLVCIVSVLICKTVKDNYKKFKNAKTAKEKKMAIVGIAIVPLAFAIMFSGYSLFSFVLVNQEEQVSAAEEYFVKDEMYVSNYHMGEELAENLNEVYWNNIPSSLKKVIVDDWTMILDTELPSSMQAMVAVGQNTYDKTGLILGGLTYHQKRLVYVNISVDYDGFLNSYIHELGHVASYEYGTLHGSPEWKSLYYNNKDKADCDGYFSSDSAEFFAWAYAEYFISPEDLESSLPDVYAYIDELNHTELDENTELFTGIKGIANMFLFYMF